MNRNLARMLLAAAGLIVVTASNGCVSYRNLVDPCWPERYNHTARRDVVDVFAPQVQNGHVLDQTIWNYMFVTGRDELNAQGRFKLDYMIRRRPQPDSNIFLQTAHDLQYNAQDPDRFAENRRDLDQRRAASIRQYVNAQTVGRPMAFEIAVHDPFEVGANAEYAKGSQKLVNAASQTGPLGALTGGGGGSGMGVGGGAAMGAGVGYGGVGGSGTTGPGAGGTPPAPGGNPQ
jgi:hypothetical protein